MDEGKSLPSDKSWVTSMVDAFRDEFPCVPRTDVYGAVETEEEMMNRWKQIPKVREMN